MILVHQLALEIMLVLIREFLFYLVHLLESPECLARLPNELCLISGENAQVNRSYLPLKQLECQGRSPANRAIMNALDWKRQQQLRPYLETPYLNDR